MAKPSFIQKTGQQWKLNGGLLLLVVGFGVLVYGVRPATSSVVYALAGTGLGVVAFLTMCFAIRCPACGFRFFWAAVSTREHNQWLAGLRTQTTCPRCNFQGGTSLRQTLS